MLYIQVRQDSDAVYGSLCYDLLLRAEWYFYHGLACPSTNYHNNGVTCGEGGEEARHDDGGGAEPGQLVAVPPGTQHLAIKI